MLILLQGFHELSEKKKPTAKLKFMYRIRSVCSIKRERERVCKKWSRTLGGWEMYRNSFSLGFVKWILISNRIRNILNRFLAVSRSIFFCSLRCRLLLAGLNKWILNLLTVEYTNKFEYYSFVCLFACSIDKIILLWKKKIVFIYL